jgi:tetratricopeptide (TPR) repeat protein
MTVPLGSAIEDWLDQLASIQQDVGQNFEPLTEVQFAWRSGQGKWSVGECLLHLAITGGLMLGKVRPAIDRGGGVSRRLGNRPCRLRARLARVYDRSMPNISFSISAGLRLAATLFFIVTPLPAQGGGAAQPIPMREASRLDSEGKTVEARVVFQKLIDEAVDPAAKAAAQRAMAMSWAFDGNCAKAVEYQEKVIAYWVTREQAEPQNAFYNQGEMANEAARVCIDAGDLDAAEQWYRKGSDLGNREPEPRTHPKVLWDYRLAHALGRLAARRGNKAEAMRQVAEAKRALESDSTMVTQQGRFYPYLTGYVALYTGDLVTAEAELIRALAMPGNQNDPFMHCLLAMVYEKKGESARAKGLYEKAYGLATGHNPPAAFVRPFARMKLGGG